MSPAGISSIFLCTEGTLKPLDANLTSLSPRSKGTGRNPGDFDSLKELEERAESQRSRFVPSNMMISNQPSATHSPGQGRMGEK